MTFKSILRGEIKLKKKKCYHTYVINLRLQCRYRYVSVLD